MPNKLSQFWQELKRRNVVRVITVYAGVAFVIIELINNITEPLRLPEWTPTFVIVLLAIGFPVVIIFSWIYDIHPEGGIVKTEPAHEVKPEEEHLSSNSWKIASYISFIVIVGLIVLNIIPRTGREKASEVLDKSIAVLPFTNMSADEENTYFIDGVMESILDNLCKIQDLRVPGRTSVIQYRENPKPIPIVAEEMDVAYVLEGSGQKIGNRLLLTVQLIIGNEDRHIWSKQYDRVIEKVEDLFDLQKEIAQLVAGEIEAIITQEEKDLIEKVPTTNLTAYDFYQRGNEELFSRGGEESLIRAEQLFHEAVRYDSTFADAYVGLARVYWSMHYWETIFEEDFMDSVRILADKALSFDPELSDAYTVKGFYYNQIGDHDKAIREFESAIEFNPNNSNAYLLGGNLYDNNDYVKSIQYYHKALALNRGDQLPARLNNLGWVYLGAGFIEKSKYYYSEAFKLTKDSLTYYSRLRMCEFVSGNFSGSIEYLEKCQAWDSTYINRQLGLGESYMMNGDYIQSLNHFKKWLEGTQSLSQGAVYGMHRIGWAYWMNGLKEEGEEFFRRQIDYINRILEMGHVLGTTYRNYYDLAATYAFMGEKDKAYENLVNFSKFPVFDSWIIMYITYDPLFDSIRDESEFQQIIHDVEAKYQAEHERVQQWLEENEML